MQRNYSMLLREHVYDSTYVRVYVLLRVWLERDVWNLLSDCIIIYRVLQKMILKILIKFKLNKIKAKK